MFTVDESHISAFDAEKFKSNQSATMSDIDIPVSLFTSDRLELTLKMKCWIELRPGYSSASASNGIDKFFNILLDTKSEKTTEIGEFVHEQSPTFNGKMILMVNDGATLQPTDVGEFFPIEEGANLMIYGADGSTIENLGNWDFYRGYIHIDDGATISLGEEGNYVDPLTGAIHIRDNAIVKQWHPLNTEVDIANITYDGAVIENLNHDGLMTYECGTDNISGSVTKTVIITPIPGESNQRLVSIRY